MNAHAGPFSACLRAFALAEQVTHCGTRPWGDRLERPRVRRRAETPVAPPRRAAPLFAASVQDRVAALGHSDVERLVERDRLDVQRTGRQPPDRRRTPDPL